MAAPARVARRAAAAAGGGARVAAAPAAGDGAGGTASTCTPGTPLTGGTQYCSNSRGNVGGGGYSYELWAEGTGTGCMTVFGVDATFNANWSNVEDFLARVGLTFDQTKTHTQIGTISADFAETKTGSNGLVYVGIYGWTVDPLREYYILDDWGTTMPAGTASDGTPRDHVGTITVDGEPTKSGRRRERTSLPSRATTRRSISTSASGRRLASAATSPSPSISPSGSVSGLPLGKLYEAKILVEAQASTGTIDFTKATVTVTR